MNKNDFYAYVSKEKLKDIGMAYQTPGYIYFKEIMSAQVNKLKACTHGRFDIHYALKANPNLTILSALSAQGIGADVASEGELNRALEAGFSPEKIEYSGPGKREDELKLAIENNIASINIENIDEIDKIMAIAKSLGKTANVAASPQVN
jgi:diaminopimelate decarboxylase